MSGSALPPPPPLRPLGRRRAGAILYLLAVVGGAIWFTTLQEPFRNGAPRSQLEQAVAGADRVVIQSGAETVLEIRDAAEVARFVALLEWNLARHEELKPQEGPVSYRVVFYRGDLEVARLEAVAKYALRWVDGPWPGDVVMKPRARGRLNEWYAERGATALRQHTGDTAIK